MANKIQIRRGIKANLPTLDIGEPAFCTDTKEFFIGTASGNAKMAYDISSGYTAPDSEKLGGQTPDYYAKQADLVSHEAESPTKTTADKTYYVNASTGNDGNDGLTSGTAFKTIGKAISVIPQVVNHAILINVADGTYNESLLLNGICGSGGISILGNTTTPINVIVNCITFNSCSLKTIAFKGFKIIATDGNQYSPTSIRVTNSRYVYIGYCNVSVSSANSYGIFFFESSQGEVTNSTISNQNIAITSGYCSTMYSENNSGTGNTIGLNAYRSGVIGKNGTQPNGATVEAIGSGGKVISSMQPSSFATNGYRYNDDGTIEQWGWTQVSSVPSNSYCTFTITLPIAFPTAYLYHTGMCAGGTNSDLVLVSSYPASSGLTQLIITVKNGATTQDISVRWSAKGR